MKGNFHVRFLEEPTTVTWSCLLDEVISIEVHENSSKETVAQALERAKEKVGDCEMVCADDGPDLRGGIAAFCEKHKVGRSFDIVHKAATYLKKILENTAQWDSFTTQAAKAKRKMQQSKASYLAPPNQRTKSRFMNIEILVNWGIDALMIMETSNHKDRLLLLEYCPWLTDLKEFIYILKQLVLVTQTVRQYIREHNLYRGVATDLEKLLLELPIEMEASQYAGILLDFVKEEASRVPEGRVWIGSSELIESLFGKVKHLEQDQCKGGFTSLILGAAACIGRIDSNTIGKALQTIKQGM